MSKLTERLEIAKQINAKLATGKFQDTGKKYTPAQATADNTNEELRMIAKLDKNNQLTWSK